MQLQENTLFADRYQLERLLGRGGFSEVWLAKDNWTHLHIAIKVYAPGQGMDANGLSEFCGELANVFDLNHTNLLKPTHVDTWNEMPYLIMAYCSQGSLAGKIQKMSEEEIWRMIHDVASGLAYLHDRDVVHQDIKPDNILVDEFGNYVITDFGISSRARSTLRKSVVGGSVSGGTTAFMAPERFSHQPSPTKASDVWSFGAMVYEVLEGIVPFGEVGGGLQKGGAELPIITADVSDALKYTVYKMLSKEPWDRPFAKDLAKWAEDPSSIRIDYDLLTMEEESATPPVSPGRSTQRFDAPPVDTTTPVNQPEPVAAPKAVAGQPVEKKKSKAWVWVVAALVFLLVVGGSAAGVVMKIVHDNRISDELAHEHFQQSSSFDRLLSEANINNIAALDSAKDCVFRLEQIEENSLYKVPRQVASDDREALLNQAKVLYQEACHRYEIAPEGSNAEIRNREKCNQLSNLIHELEQ